MLNHPFVRGITTVGAAVAALALATTLVVLAPATFVGAADGPQSPAPTLVPAAVDSDATPFTLSLPGVSCDGTGADGWRMSTFIVNAGVNLSTLDFTAGFPPGSVGSDYDASDGSIMAPLYRGNNPGVTFIPASSPPGLINPVDLAAYDFTLAEWNLVSGGYQIGFACTGPSTELRQWWSIPVTINTAAAPFMVVSEGEPEPEATTVAVTAAPASSTVGQSVTFTAAVTPSGAAGSIEFRVGGVAQSTSAVAGGTATWTTSALTAGTRSITAAFTPTDPALFNASTSSALSYVVSGASAQVTSVALTADPASPAAAGQLVTLTATVTPTAAPGAVTFAVDGVGLGAPVIVASGVATLATTELAVGDRSLTAAFVPTNAEAFSGSTGTLAYTVASSDGEETTVELVSDPAGQAAVGEEVTFTATVAPEDVPGTVSFVEDGQVLGGPVDVTDGEASFATSELAEGTHSIVASFTPTDTEAYQPSSSAALALVVGTPDPTDPTDPDPTDPGGTDDFTDVAGSTTDVLPLTGVSLGAAGVGLVLVYVGRVLYLVGRPPRPSATRR